MERYIGRPTNLEGRREVEVHTYDFLDKLGIFYETVCHAAAYTMEECQEVEKNLGVPICKNLFLCNRQQTQFYLLMLPGRSISRPSSFLLSLVVPDCPLQRKSTWLGCSVSIPVQSLPWD